LNSVKIRNWNEAKLTKAIVLYLSLWQKYDVQKPWRNKDLMQNCISSSLKIVFLAWLRKRSPRCWNTNLLDTKHGRWPSYDYYIC